MNQRIFFRPFLNAALRTIQIRCVAFGCVLIAYGVLIRQQTGAAEPKPGEELSIVFDVEGKQVPFTFRFCPSGQIIPGEPKQDSASSGKPSPSTGFDLLGGPTKVSAFYLSETEVTVSQYAQVVGLERFRQLTERAAKMKGAKEDVALLNAANNKSPVFLVKPLEAIAFCNSLNALKTSGTAQARSEIERWEFRLPSHIEWQYACRGEPDANSENKYPHFHSWADFDTLDKNDRAKCLEEWKEMGRQESEFVGTQFQVAEIITKRYSTTNSKPLEILNVFLKNGIHSRRDFSKSTTASLSTIQATGPNAWGLYDMHDNVREWTIAVDDRDELQRLWKDLASRQPISPENRQRRILFLAGGAANDTMAGGAVAAWKAFSIWGGRPMDIKVGAPIYFSLAEDEDTDKTFDYDPGIRLLLERVLVDDWLLAIRRRTVLTKEQPVQATASLDKYRQIIREIVAETEKKEKEATLGYYSGLAQYRLGKIAEAASILDAQKGSLAPVRKKKVDLRSLGDLASQPGRDTKQKAGSGDQSEDAVYLDLLTELVKRDQQQLGN